jgi:glycosyltransferase involved in cell wall biosynthesis
MRVGLNLLHLVPGETGGSEIYARRLIPALLATGIELRLTLFAGTDAAASLRQEEWASDVEIIQLMLNARSRVRRVLAEQTLLPRAARRARVDLLHNLFTTAPAWPRGPQVTTILDVIYKRFPETHPGLLTYGMRMLVPLSAKRSRRVLTLSNAAKDDIVRFLGVSPDRVDVTYLGPGIHEGTIPVDEPEVRRRLELRDGPLVLTVSAKRPHKNLERLIHAIGLLPSPVMLVVPGYTTAFEDSLRRHADAVAPGRVRFTGWVDEATLEGLYAAATAFVFPSLAEGFGLPVLEALARGVPVACSNTSSLPEVAGDAVLYFDPTETKAIAGSIEQLVADAELRERLRAAGPDQARRFSWDRTAAQTLASYERALAVRSSRRS